MEDLDEVIQLVEGPAVARRRERPFHGVAEPPREHLRWMGPGPAVVLSASLAESVTWLALALASLAYQRQLARDPRLVTQPGTSHG